MGTCSYVLTGTDKGAQDLSDTELTCDWPLVLHDLGFATPGMRETFGSTCHGAGRALSQDTQDESIGSVGV